MEISGITGLGNIGTESGSETKKRNELGKEEFLGLLLKQLSYQDPLNPMDSTEFTAQLTRFSSIEELANINDTLGDILSFQQSMQNATVTNMIGKDVKVSGNSVYLNDTALLNYDLPEVADSLNISVFDSAGRLVHNADLGPAASGAGSYIWDGTDSSGNKLPDGVYNFRVDALDSEGNLLQSHTSSSGKVTGVSFKDGMTYLVLEGGREVYLSDVKYIEESQTI